MRHNQFLAVMCLFLFAKDGISEVLAFMLDKKPVKLNHFRQLLNRYLTFLNVDIFYYIGSQSNVFFFSNQSYTF